MNKKLTLLGVVLCIALSSARVTNKRSLVLSTESPPDEKHESKQDDKDSGPVVPKIYEMRIDTNVSNRYANTLITSKVRNLHSKAQEATFSVVTPEKAFISGFTMEIDGKKYEAYVQEKEEAKQTYDRAVSSGQSAAHVAVSARDSNRFTVSVNVEPQSKATFYLTYEELLIRKDDKYEIVLNIHPGQPVKDLEVQVNVKESRPLKFVKVPSLRSGNEISKNDKTQMDPEADIKTINETSAVVTFRPDIIKQKLFASSLGGKEENGLNGQFVVQYDVTRDPQGGEVLVHGGYFVHFFAPEELPPLKKQVVFVLDTSGSMSGIRITQLKEAMNSILAELKPEDVFSIVEFNSVVKVWNVPGVKIAYQEGEDPYFSYSEKPKEPLENILPPSFDASEDNVKKAKEVIQKLDAFGGTDIQAALKIGLQIVSRNKDLKAHQPIIVFLTDGEPTVGEFNTNKITMTITELNTIKVPIFSLSFGDGADRDFLQKLSLKNQGFARHIYEAADAYLQLEDFYKQISSPLLSDVTFKYVDTVKNVTRKHFPILFGGGELYTTGIIVDAGSGFTPPAVEAWGLRGPIRLEPKVYPATGSLERLWAYLTVKQLLEQRDVAEDKKGPTQDALKLALKYSFVTDVSSLVVVKPNATSAVETEDAAKSDNSGDRNYALLSLPPGGSGASYSLSSPIAPQFISAGFAGYPGAPLGGGSYSLPRPVGISGPPGPRNAYGGGYYPLSSHPGLSYQKGSYYGGGPYSSARLPGPMPVHGFHSSRPVGLSAPIGPPGPVNGGRVALRTGISRPSANMPFYVDADDLVDIRVVEESSAPSYEAVVVDDTDDSHDRIFGGSPPGFSSGAAGGFDSFNKQGSASFLQPLSTTVNFLPPTTATTSVRPLEEKTDSVAESEAESPEAPVNAIFSNIPWLNTTLNEDGAITLDSGTYPLGLDEHISLQQECHNSVNNTIGTCTLLHECPQIHKELVDLTTYKQHFCQLQSFAAVCCPKDTDNVKGH